ncbi:MAG: hypothetical protein HGGPFJEG_00057 [Ignavibacteria bacterium]|nr:hypothetical protein [Ignavibacteria bacterium]
MHIKKVNVERTKNVILFLNPFKTINGIIDKLTKLILMEIIIPINTPNNKGKDLEIEILSSLYVNLISSDIKTAIKKKQCFQV